MSHPDALRYMHIRIDPARSRLDVRHLDGMISHLSLARADCGFAQPAGAGGLPSTVAESPGAGGPSSLSNADVESARPGRRAEGVSGRALDRRAAAAILREVGKALGELIADRPPDLPDIGAAEATLLGLGQGWPAPLSAWRPPSGGLATDPPSTPSISGCLAP